MDGWARSILLAGSIAMSVAIAGCGKPGDDLEYKIAEATHQMQGQLPMRVDDVTTLTGVRHEGTNIIYEMSVDRELSADELQAAPGQMQANNQRNMCGQPPTLELIRMGASLTHRYTDKAGHHFETRVSACPA